MLKFSIIRTKASINNGIFNSKTFLHELKFLQVSLLSWSKLHLNQIFKLCVTSNNNFLNELLFSEFRQEIKFLPRLEFSKKRFFILVSCSTEQKNASHTKKTRFSIKTTNFEKLQVLQFTICLLHQNLFQSDQKFTEFFVFSEKRWFYLDASDRPQRNGGRSLRTPQKFWYVSAPSKFMVFFLTALTLRDSTRH